MASVDKPDLEKRDEQPRADAERRGAEAELRASDADRDRVADILRDALAEGRLTTAEHAERIDVLYAARTMGELEPLTRDLPVPAGDRRPAPEEPQVTAAPLPSGQAETPTMVAIFGGASRKGRWRVGGDIQAFALFGGVEIDLTEAVFESPRVVIRTVALFGGVDIKVPENVSVRGNGGFAVFGGFDVSSHEAEDGNAPVVEVKGFAMFGGVNVKRKRGKRLKEWHRKHLGH